MGEIVARQPAVEVRRNGPSRNLPVPSWLGGYLRGHHRQKERHFEVIAAKTINAAGIYQRFAFVGSGQVAWVEAFAQARAAAVEC
jgi:hypothetical protein